MKPSISRLFYPLILITFILLPIFTRPVWADEPGQAAGGGGYRSSSSSDYDQNYEDERSHRSNSSSARHTWWEATTYYIANRLIDFIDIFRIDVGVGAAAGGVIRLTRDGQIGYRIVDPFSARIGDFGRRASPVLVERDSEHGVGADFRGSRDRKVCRSEFGLGLDLGIGGYFGVCFEEVGDFFAGLFTADPSDDDIR